MKVYIVMEYEANELIKMKVFADRIDAQTFADNSDYYAYVIEKDVA